MVRVLNSIPLLYLVMLWPGRLSISDVFTASWYYPQMMLETGLLSVWFMILTLAVTPMLITINLLGRGAKVGAWLLRRRKHFGLVSFIFAGLHLFHYIRETREIYSIWVEAFYMEYAVGWVAFAILLLLAVTSNRASVRRLGARWKLLHRLVYVAAFASILHWYLFDFVTGRVIFWGAVLLLVKVAHMGLRQCAVWRRQQRATL